MRLEKQVIDRIDELYQLWTIAHKTDPSKRFGQFVVEEMKWSDKYPSLFCEQDDGVAFTKACKIYQDLLETAETIAWRRRAYPKG